MVFWDGACSKTGFLNEWVYIDRIFPSEFQLIDKEIWGNFNWNNLLLPCLVSLCKQNKFCSIIYLVVVLGMCKTHVCIIILRYIFNKKSFHYRLSSIISLSLLYSILEKLAFVVNRVWIFRTMLIQMINH